MIALLVMLNNYFHDLATAVFAVAAVAGLVLHRQLERQPVDLAPLRPVIRAITRFGIGAFVWLLLAGIVHFVGGRSLNYKCVQLVGANIGNILSRSDIPVSRERVHRPPRTVRSPPALFH